MCSCILCNAFIWQALLEDRSAVEREKSQLVTNEAALQSQVQQLQTAVSQLQQELQESHTELETKRRGKFKPSRLNAILFFPLSL